jgi:hypothetical protein
MPHRVRKPKNFLRLRFAMSPGLALLIAGSEGAQPFGTVDHNGSNVASGQYAPNFVRLGIAVGLNQIDNGAGQDSSAKDVPALIPTVTSGP